MTTFYCILAALLIAAATAAVIVARRRAEALYYGMPRAEFYARLYQAVGRDKAKAARRGTPGE